MVVLVSGATFSSDFRTNKNKGSKIVRSMSLLFCVSAFVAGPVPAIAETGFKPGFAGPLASRCSLEDAVYQLLFRTVELVAETSARPGIGCREIASLFGGAIIPSEGGLPRSQRSLVPKLLPILAPLAEGDAKPLVVLASIEGHAKSGAPDLTMPRQRHLGAVNEKLHSGRMSWFGQYNYGRHRDKSRKAKHVWRDLGDNGKNASGLPQTVPGIALTNRKTLGHWYEVKLNGAWYLARHVDMGPARYTGRTIDINAPLADMAGWSPKNFPTDKKATWRYVGRVLTPRHLADMQAPADLPKVEPATATARVEIASAANDTAGRLPEEQAEELWWHGKPQLPKPAMRMPHQSLRTAGATKNLSTMNWPPLSRVPVTEESRSQVGNLRTN
jgi:hypothetical protein